MKRRLRTPFNAECWLALTATLFMIGCGATTATTNDPKSCQSFINQSNQTDATLQADWKSAQNDIANPPGTCLNEIDMATTGAKCKVVLDARAKNVWPCRLTIISVPDGGTGAIPCPSGSHFSQCVGYSSNNTIWVAASGLGPFAIRYEMENIILAALGYDTSNR